MSDRALNSDVLNVARESRGRTQEEVADVLGVRQGLVSKAEQGVVTLNPEQVAAIADYLAYPPEIFYEPGRVREVGSPCLYHRKRKALPAKVLKRLDARMYLRNINVQKLLDGLEVEGDRAFHTLDPDEYGSAVAVARVLRKAWRLPEGPTTDLTALIESAGGIVLMEDFGHRKLFGMSCWTTRGHPLFFLNAAVPMEDLRWTMAHELGHLTMHATPAGTDPELEADAFAGELLAPESLFRHDARNLTFSRLANLKTYWRLSMKAIIKRAETIGAINRQTAVRLYKQHSARGYNAAEPYPLPKERPTLVKTAINVRLQEHDYAPDELARVIGLSRDEFYRDLWGEKLPSHPENVIPLFGGPDAASG